jgi:catechol-2,3-dioxygenase
VATKADLDDFQRRFQEHGIENHGPIDHHFVKSIYAWDPNGIQIEITWRDPDHAKIMADERAKSAGIMKDWNRDTMPMKSGKLKLRSAAST